MTRHFKTAIAGGAAAALLFAGSALGRDAEVWTPVTYGERGVGLVDMAHVERVGDITRVHIAIAFKEPVGGFFVVGNQQELRCADFTARQSGPMEFYDAKGKLVSKSDFAGGKPFDKIEKGSNLGNLMDVVCGFEPTPPESYPTIGAARAGVLAGDPKSRQAI